MIRVAIVDDEQECIDRLEAVLKRYASSRAISVSTASFLDAERFLDCYSGNYELVFLDIDMPGMNGMKAAEKLREIDKRVILIFVTNLANMAARGYDVEAFDFAVKPIHYEMMCMKIDRAIRKMQQWEDHKISISSKGTYLWLSASAIYYVEVMDHQLIYHTDSGAYTVYGSMSKAAAELELLGFARCNSGYLVNLRYVSRVCNNTVLIADRSLPISKPRKKDFLQALNQYIGG